MKQKLTLWAICCLMVFLLPSCTKNKMKDLLAHVPEDAEVVFVADLSTMLESAGGKIENEKIKLPASITDPMPDDMFKLIDNANDLIRKGGVDPEACAITMNYEHGQPVFVFALADPKKFVNYIEDNGFREKESDKNVTIYSKRVYESPNDPEYDDYGYIAVVDDYAYWVERVWVKSDFKAMDVLGDMAREVTSKENFARTAFGKYISKGNAAGMSVRINRKVREELSEAGMPDELCRACSGVLCFKSQLKGNELAIDMKMFDEEGNEKKAEDFKALCDMEAKINPKALDFMGKNEMLVTAVALKDVNWTKFFSNLSGNPYAYNSNREAMAMMQRFLEKSNGTVAFGFGFNNGLEPLMNASSEDEALNEMSMTLVIETKQSQAKSMLNGLKDLMNNNLVPFEDRADGFELQLPGSHQLIRAKAVDNFVVIANHAISTEADNKVVKEVPFKDYSCACALLLDKNNKLLKDLGIDNGIKAVVASGKSIGEISLTVTVDGKQEGFIANTASLILAANAKVQEAQKKRVVEEVEADSAAVYDPYGDEGYYVDSAVVDDYAADTEADVAY